MTSGPTAPAPQSLEVRPAGHRWVWRFREGDLKIDSAGSYATVSEAAAAARAAYPGVDVTETHDPEAQERPSFWTRLLMTLVLWRRTSRSRR